MILGLKNFALIEATKSTIRLLLSIYIKEKLDSQEAQKWWISKSLNLFKKTINLKY